MSVRSLFRDMEQKIGCSKCRFGRRGCSRCNPLFVPLRGHKRAPCTIIVVPFARTDPAGKIFAQKGICWTLTSRAQLNALTTVDVYFGTDWRSPPYDASKGVVLRLTLAQSACVMHVPDTSVTVGEVVAALKTATKATLVEAPGDDMALENSENSKNSVNSESPRVPDDPCDSDDFDLNSLDMDRYDRVAFNSYELPNNMSLSKYVKQDVYNISNPMILHVLLR